jgi:hypothetical protein
MWRKDFRLILFLAPLVFARESSVWHGEIPAQFSQEVGEITAHPTFVRHPKPRSIYLSTEFYGFLLQDWDLAYRLAKTLDVKGYEVRKLDRGWRVILGPRTSVDVLPLAHRNGRSFFLAKGEHHGKVIQHLNLRAFLLVECHPLAIENVSITENEMTSYIRIEQFFLAAIAKITIPFIGERIDRKLATILQDVEQISRRIHENPAAVRTAIEENSQFTTAEKQKLKGFLDPAA